MRAKFRNDSNFWVREIGRECSVEEHSLTLEIMEVSRGGGRRWPKQESGLQIFWEKDRESLSCLVDIILQNIHL